MPVAGSSHLTDLELHWSASHDPRLRPTAIDDNARLLLRLNFTNYGQTESASGSNQALALSRHTPKKPSIMPLKGCGAGCVETEQGRAVP